MFSKTLRIFKKLTQMRYLIIYWVFSMMGHFTAYYFYVQSYSQIEEIERVAFYNDWMPLYFWFSTSIGALPFMYLLIRETAPLKSIFQSILVVLLIIGSGVCLWQLRIYEINKKLQANPKTIIDEDLLFLELYWLSGLILGTLIGLVVLRYSIRVKK